MQYRQRMGVTTFTRPRAFRPCTGGRLRTGRLKVGCIVATASAVLGGSVLAAPASAAPAPAGPAVSAPPASVDAAVPVPGSADWAPARGRADRILQIIGSDAPVDPAEALGMADPQLAVALLPQTLADVLTAWQASGPYTVTSTDDDGPSAVTHVTTARGVAATLTVHVDPVGLIDGITMLPDVPEVHDFAEVQAAASAVGADVSMLAADVDLDAADSASQCTPVYAADADRVMPLGSMFKLYVLGALGTAIEDGEMSWDDTLTITDDVKSLPSGELQNRPAGTEVTVREAADKMIAISDNTAADMLVHRLGPDRIEAALSAMGDEHPEALTPFPTTREAFIIGWGSDPTLRQRWRDGDTEQRRAILAEADEKPLTGVDVHHLMNTPMGPDDIGWYASASDICRAHVSLQRLAAEGGATAPIRDILSQNPGVPVEGEQYVAFKGGSTAGRLAGSWLVTGDDGASHSLVFQMASDRPIGSVEQNYVFGLMEQALGLFSGCPAWPGALRPGIVTTHPS